MLLFITSIARKACDISL